MQLYVQLTLLLRRCYCDVNVCLLRLQRIIWQAYYMGACALVLVIEQSASHDTHTHTYKGETQTLLNYCGTHVVYLIYNDTLSTVRVYVYCSYKAAHNEPDELIKVNRNLLFPWRNNYLFALFLLFFFISISFHSF